MRLTVREKDPVIGYDEKNEETMLASPIARSSWVGSSR